MCNYIQHAKETAQTNKRQNDLGELRITTSYKQRKEKIDTDHPPKHRYLAFCQSFDCKSTVSAGNALQIERERERKRGLLRSQSRTRENK